MTDRSNKFASKVEYRHVNEARVYTRVFRGKDHAVNTAAFVTFNKKDWNYHLISTLHKG